MIYARVIHDCSEDELTVEITGHAGYAAPGEDIVCAGVSALVLFAYNVCKEMDGESEMEDGYAKFVFKENEQAERFSAVLLDTLYYMAIRYSDYLSVEEDYHESE